MPYKGHKLSSLFEGNDIPLLMRELADKGGDTMVDWTVKNTPIDTGNLRTSWYQLDVNKKRVGVDEAWQSGVATEVDYAPHVEYGTGLWGPSKQRYTIRPKDPNGWLHWKDRRTGKDVFAKAVQHPGSPGQHMVAIAAQMTEAEMEAIAEPIINAWIRARERAA